MKITFIGIHFKEGKAALDSTTKSGKVIDRIINRFGHLHNFDKTNLFRTLEIPDVNGLNVSMTKFKDEGLFVLLGKSVWNYFPYDLYTNAKIAKVYHPAYPRGHNAVQEYVRSVWATINTFTISDFLSDYGLVEKCQVKDNGFEIMITDGYDNNMMNTLEVMKLIDDNIGYLYPLIGYCKTDLNLYHCILNPRNKK